MTDKAFEASAYDSHAIPPRRGDPRGVDYQTREWSPGTRGGGKVPDDFAWRTNPKQQQEELGASAAEERDLSKERLQKR